MASRKLTFGGTSEQRSNAKLEVTFTQSPPVTYTAEFTIDASASASSVAADAKDAWDNINDPSKPSASLSGSEIEFAIAPTECVITMSTTVDPDDSNKPIGNGLKASRPS